MELKFNRSLSLFVAAWLSGCHPKEELMITPISEEFNHQYLSGQGLNSRYFSKDDVMQYYQVSNEDAFRESRLLEKLNAFVKARYRLSRGSSMNSLTILFYKKRQWINYADGLVESARVEEDRSINGHQDDLLARIVYTRLKADADKAAHWLLLYTRKGKPISLRDTVSLR